MGAINFGAGVAERDIDLLLMEEFFVSKEFQNWFLTQVSSPTNRLNSNNLTFISAEHSNYYFNGETDLIIKFAKEDKEEYWLLIEDKIAAQFQPNQIKRYVERAAQYVMQKQCLAAYPILVAPETYTKKIEIDLKNGFVAKVTYEAIRDWFKDNTEMDPVRRDYKIQLLEKAISQKGYVLYTIEPVIDFWNKYQAIVNELYPELNLEKEPPSGRDNFWGYSPKHLTKLSPPVKVSLVHKLFVASRKGGFVDLQFQDMGKDLDTIQAIFGSQLEKDMTILQTGKSGTISIQVQALYNEWDFESQKEAVEIGIKTVWRLSDWFSRHSHLWDEYWERQK